MKITIVGAIILIGGVLLLIVFVGGAVENERAKTNKPSETDTTNGQPNPSA